MAHCRFDDERLHHDIGPIRLNTDIVFSNVTKPMRFAWLRKKILLSRIYPVRRVRLGAESRYVLRTDQIHVDDNPDR